MTWSSVGLARIGGDGCLYLSFWASRPEIATRYFYGSATVTGRTILAPMDPPQQTLPEPTSLLAEVFDTRTQKILQETCGDECHAFEMYDARNAMVRQAAYR